MLNISAPYVFSSSELLGREAGDTVFHTEHQLPIEYDNLLLPSFLEGEESTPSFNKGLRNAGRRSFVSSTHSRGAGLHSPSAKRQKGERKSVRWWEKRAAGNTASDKDTWEPQKTRSANPE